MNCCELLDTTALLELGTQAYGHMTINAEAGKSAGEQTDIGEVMTEVIEVSPIIADARVMGRQVRVMMVAGVHNAGEHGTLER